MNAETMHDEPKDVTKRKSDARTHCAVYQGCGWAMAMRRLAGQESLHT